MAQDEDNVNTNTVTDAPSTDTTENETKPKDKSDDNENNNQKPRCPGVIRIYGVHRIDPFGYGRRPMPGPRYEFDYPPYYIRRHWPSLYPGNNKRGEPGNDNDYGNRPNFGPSDIPSKDEVEIL